VTSVSLNRQIGEGIVWVAAFTVLARLVNALKEIAIAYRFGATELVDAYVLVFAFVTWLPAVWLSLMQTVFVPQAMRMPDAERQLFVRELTGVLIVAGAVLSATLAIGLPEFVLAMSPEHPAPAELRAFSRQMAPIVVLGLVTSQLIALLVMRKQHGNAVLEGVPSIAILVLVLSVGTADALGFGTLAGFALQVLVAAALLGSSAPGLPRLGFSAPAWPRFAAALRIAVFGQLLLALAYPVDQLIANTMEAGDAARFAYAYRLVAFVMAIGSLAIGRVVLPVLAERSHARGWQITRDWTLRVVALGVVGITSNEWPVQGRWQFRPRPGRAARPPHLPGRTAARPPGTGARLGRARSRRAGRGHPAVRSDSGRRTCA
jgi:peptidoglycan biosynthesis protein MviN/MurJ (putative lipid II flippase)